MVLLYIEYNDIRAYIIAHQSEAAVKDLNNITPIGMVYHRKDDGTEVLRDFTVKVTTNLAYNVIKYIPELSGATRNDIQVVDHKGQYPFQNVSLAILDRVLSLDEYEYDAVTNAVNLLDELNGFDDY